MSNWAFLVRALRISQLPAVLRRPERIPHRHLDDAHGNRLAGVPADRLALLLGAVSFAGQIPPSFSRPSPGVLVDRWDRHRMLVVTQCSRCSSPWPWRRSRLAGVIAVWHIVLLALCQGVINAFDMPATTVVRRADGRKREDLPNAIALNSSMVNAARLSGPRSAGVVIAAVGEADCFLIDGVSYLAVIASLLMMRLAARRGTQAGRNRSRDQRGLDIRCPAPFPSAPSCCCSPWSASLECRTRC